MGAILRRIFCYSFRKIFISCLILLTFVAFQIFAPLPLSKAAAAEKAPKLTFAAGIPPGAMEPILFSKYMQENVLKNYGKKYKLDLLPSQGSSQNAQALAAEQADIGMLAAPSFVTPVLKNMVPGGLTIVADLYVEGYQDWGANHFLVRADSGFNSIKDMKGKKIGVALFGTAVDIQTRIHLINNGMDPEKDVNLVEIAFPSQGVALREKRIDGSLFIPPFQWIEEEKGGVKVLFTGKNAIGTNEPVFYAARTKYLKENPEAVKAFWEDWVIALKWSYDPKNRQKLLDITTQAVKLPRNILEKYMLTKADLWRDANACPHPEFIQPTVDAMHKVGYIKEKLDVAKFVDASYLPYPCK